MAKNRLHAMQNKVFIRVDGSPTIGFGHVYRCMALAEMLVNDFEIHFFSAQLPDSVIAILKAKNFHFSAIEDDDAFLKQLSRESLVVLDNYFYPTELHKRIRATGAVLICIDDLHDQAFSADLIINHAPGVVPNDYKSLPYTHFALGLDYVLLRQKFLDYASSDGKVKDPKSVFICFGGSDPKNLSEKVLKWVLAKGNFSQINLVTGPGYGHHEELLPLTQQHAKVAYYHDLDEQAMMAILIASGAAIVPTSGVFLETLAMGCKIIAGYYVDNQRMLFECFKAGGYFISAEEFSEDSFTTALVEFEWQQASHVSPIDGLSGQRILKLFKSLALGTSLTLRLANEGDLQKTFNWAADKTVRQYAYNQNPIVFEDHSKWFLTKITDPECMYLILGDKTDSIGSIRFDLKAGKALISYLIDPQHHGKGLGTMILKKGMERLIHSNGHKINKIVGDVMRANIASARAFEKLGFDRLDVEDANYRYTKTLT